jgi:integrase
METRPYRLEEIKRLLDFSDLRFKCIILLMASAGLRRGAIPDLNYGNLEKIEKYNLYKIRVYSNDSKRKYTTYCTPECAKHLDEYFQWRQRLGEVFTAKTPVIRQEFDKELHVVISIRIQGSSSSALTYLDQRVDLLHRHHLQVLHRQKYVLMVQHLM